MSNIFAGLEDLGFKNVEKVDVYQESDSEKKSRKRQNRMQKKKQMKKICFSIRATPVRYATMNLRAVW